MQRYYVLSAIGRDRPGIVAAIARTLFEAGCNLEDSAMMRLGNEFGVFLYFTSARNLSLATRARLVAILNRRNKLYCEIRESSAAAARFRPAKNLYAIRVSGPDHAGLVYRVTALLSQFGFNITDLNTHRISQRRPGFILAIEGEFPRGAQPALSALRSLAKRLKAEISVEQLRVTVA